MYILLLLIILICALIIGYIIVSKFSQLTLVETSTSSDEKQDGLKRALLEQRLKRQLFTGFKFIGTIVQPIWEALVNSVDKLISIFKKKEEEYRHKLLHADFKEEVDKEQKISKLMIEADELLNDKKIKEAEIILIDVLKLDTKHKEAYMKLARLYWDQKDYDHAIELYNYLLKIFVDSEIYSNLGEIAEERGNLKEAENNYISALELNDRVDIVHYNLAKLYYEQEELDKSLEMIKKSLEIQPNSPKYLDFLLQVSIMVQDKKLANETLQSLAKVNPDNQKLDEYKELVDEL